MKGVSVNWGKIIGSIVALTGFSGLFYQIYKIGFSFFYSQIQPPVIENPPGLDPRIIQYQQQMLHQINGSIGMDAATAKALLIFGGVGILMLVFYLVGGLKLVINSSISNYRFVKYAIIGFILYNAIGLTYFFSYHPGMFIKMILIYSSLGLGVDIILFLFIKKNEKTMLSKNTTNEKPKVFKYDRSTRM